MNIENQPEDVVIVTLGQRLKEARMLCEMSQQDIADKLCLKLSIIRDIEADKNIEGVSEVFWRGYLRAYAKLVKIPEQELKILLSGSQPDHVKKSFNMRNFSQKEARKKRDKWLAILTCFILLVVLSLTGVWWWQKHQEKQIELAALIEQTTPIIEQTTSTIPTITDPVMDDELPLAVLSELPPQSLVPIEDTQVIVENEPQSILTVAFKYDCWLEVTNADNGKVLFVGTKKKGEHLDFHDNISYKFKIGAPGAVIIQHKGNPVDMSEHIKVNKVARLTLNANN